jgi:hypothetical protein
MHPRLTDWDWRLAGLLVALTVTMMQRIEDAKLRLPRSIQDLQQIFYVLSSYAFI